jgi:hypothetical protein
MVRIAYPGSFDPPTVAHLAIAHAARDHLDASAVHWIVSRAALGKADATAPTFDDRIAVLREVATEHRWLEIHVTNARFIADVADGYDAVVLGADKWRQVIDPSWYDSADECEHFRQRLPRVLVVPRANDRPLGVELLDVASSYRSVSSTAARAGTREFMVDAAQRFDIATGAWTDPDRYRSSRPQD